VIDLVFRTGTVTVTSDFEVIVNTIPEAALKETTPEMVLCGNCEKESYRCYNGGHTRCSCDMGLHAVNFCWIWMTK